MVTIFQHFWNLGPVYFTFYISASEDIALLKVKIRNKTIQIEYNHM